MEIIGKKYPKLSVYADNTLVIIGGDNREEIRVAVTKCISWVQVNRLKAGLSLNIGKTKILLRDRTPKETQMQLGPIKFQIGTATLQGKSSIVHLGVTLDAKLTF